MLLQAYERQVDVLSRQASQGQTETEDLDRERHSLLDRLRAAEQVRAVSITSLYWTLD